MRILRILLEQKHIIRRQLKRRFFKKAKNHRSGAYLRAMLKTLVLLRMRCGCFDTELEEEGGVEESVWTFEKTNMIIIL